MRLDIPAKLSVTLFLIICAVTLSWYIHAVLFAILVLIGILLQSVQEARTVGRPPFRRFLITIVLFVILITMLNGLLLREGEAHTTSVGLTLYDGGLEFGLRTSFRLAVISTALVLFFTFTPFRDFLVYLQHTRVPTPLIVILFLSLHFIGQLPERIAQIFIAQEARGAEVRGNILARTKAFAAILSPLVLSSIIETLERGAALEARGFRGRLTSHQKVSSPSLTSRMVTVVFLLASFVLAVWSLFV